MDGIVVVDDLRRALEAREDVHGQGEGAHGVGGLVAGDHERRWPLGNTPELYDPETGTLLIGRSAESVANTVSPLT